MHYARWTAWAATKRNLGGSIGGFLQLFLWEMRELGLGPDGFKILTVLGSAKTG
jgi:hypothetical protein